MIISAIVAATRNWVIGKDNEIPWYLPSDLKYFKKTTLDHHIIMGRKNYESIGRPLPKRVNIVVTRKKGYEAPGCVVVHSIEDALKVARDNKETEAFICGGGEIYKQTMDIIDRLYFTEIEATVEGDIFFPEFSEDDWELVSIERNQADDRNEYGYNFKVYERVDKQKK